MLVIQADCGERIIIRFGSEECEVTLLRTKKDKAWLGFEAPLEFEINREKVQRAIDEQRRQV